MNDVRVDRYNPARDSLAEITELLHQAYAPLAAQGFNYVAASQNAEVTSKRLAAGESYVARAGEKIVGVITYYPRKMAGIDEPSIYAEESAGHFGQFAVLPSMQKLGVGYKLLTLVEQVALEAGKTIIACDTAEGATHLIAYYQNLGYEPAGYHRWSHACYRSIILCKTLGAGSASALN